MDRGEEMDWFGSRFILIMAIVAALGIGGAIAWLLYTPDPVVDLRVMRDRNFALGCVMIGAMGCVLYASAVVIPQFAQQQLGYTATWAGFILSPGGLVVIVLIPLVGQITRVVPLKYVIAFGFFLMGCSLIYSHNLVPMLDFWTLAKMRAFQTAGLAFMFVPISTIAFSTLPQADNADGSALFTMSRNYFGSLSISAATAIVQDRTQVHQAHLTDHTSMLSPGYVFTMKQVEHSLLAQGHAAGTTMQGATNWLYQQLHAQAAVLAYSDVFMVTAVLSFLIVPLCFFASNRSGGGGGPAH